MLLGGALAVTAAAPVAAQTAQPTAPAATEATRPTRQGPASVADLAERLQGAVVNISTTQTLPAEKAIPMPQAPDGSPLQEFFDEFFKNQMGKNGGAPRKVQSLGSGFVVDPSGLVVTNNHVIDGADEITVNFTDGAKLKATVVGRDKKTDIALLRVKPAKPLVAVGFGDSDEARVGDWVMAIGNPFGFGGSVTLGIVSARNRDIHAGPYDNFIQTDAAINKGNSGGPLFDMFGKVVGINTAIVSPTGGSIGIGFAVPSKTASAVVDQLKQFGETRRGWLGVRIQGVTDDIAESLGLKEAKGALVAGLTDKGPAAKAGI
ncbi:MAG: trypsin-like serine protease, partial [Phyllobacteriaceae bacterium]|nr:trypsin-like serine protease [Phyllobacteriaceae bacterium]